MSRPFRHRGLMQLGNLDDPDGFGVHIARFLDYLRTRGFSTSTVSSRVWQLRHFVGWCEQRSIEQPKLVTRLAVRRFQRHLMIYRKRDGQPLAHSSQSQLLTAVRSFFKWMVKDGQLTFSPAADIDLPKRERRLPRHVLTAAEADQVMNQPDLSTVLGLRDRAMLETLYSTAIRRLELTNLGVYDLDVDRGAMMVQLGKGGKDRVVPIGERALAWIDRYQLEARPELATGDDPGFIFLTNDGRQLGCARLSKLVCDYVKESGVGKKGSCHLFRHTAATLMLEGGADVRYIQEMLGHASLDTTQIYTKVSISKLKAVHAATHPGSALQRVAASEATHAELSSA